VEGSSRRKVTRNTSEEAKGFKPSNVLTLFLFFLYELRVGIEISVYLICANVKYNIGLMKEKLTEQELATM